MIEEIGNLILTTNGALRILTAKDGYVVYSVSTNNTTSKVYLGKNDSVDNYRALPVTPTLTETEIAELDNVKDKAIEVSKENLAIYLKEHPLLSYIKYQDGRYYNVTSEKQQQLTSTLLMYQGYAQAGLEYDLKWNDMGNVCESWEYAQLFMLSMEIDAYVKIFVEMQQCIEVSIRNAQSIEEVSGIDVEFSEENIAKYTNI